MNKASLYLQQQMFSLGTLMSVTLYDRERSLWSTHNTIRSHMDEACVHISKHKTSGYGNICQVSFAVWV